MDKKLIINADDYGMCHAGNDAVEELFNQGAITSTTLMTPCPWAEDALRRASLNDKMNVGLHLTFTSEWGNYKWAPVNKNAPFSLIGDDGYFYRDCKTFLERANPAEVIAEMESQYAFMVSRGYRPTHVDNHMGSLYGLEGVSYLKEVLEFCGKYRLAFRLPKNADGYGMIPENLRKTYGEVVQYAYILGVGLIDDLKSITRPITTEDTYETIKKEYIGLVRNLREGITELYMHPAKDTEELRALGPMWQMRVWEYTLLQDEDFKNAIERNGVQLVGWGSVE